MSTIQDTFADSSKLTTLIGTEVSGGWLRGRDISQGGYRYFDGGDYVTCGSDASINITGDLTITAWIYPMGVMSSGMIVEHLIAGETEATNANYWMRVATNEIDILWEYGSGTNVVVATTTSPISELNKWYHVALTRSVAGTSTVTFFINGVEIESTTGLTNASGGADSILSIGGEYDGSDNFNGNLKDIRIYNAVLSDEEIFGLYSSGIEPPTTNLQAHYTMLSALNDSSGNANDGTNFGSTQVVAPTASTEFFNPKGLASSTEIFSTVSSISANEFKYTISEKPGGSKAQLQFCNDYDANRENVLELDGSVDYVALDGTIDDDWATGFSIAGWYNNHATGTVDNLCGNRTASDGFSLYLSPATGNWQFFGYNSGTAWSVSVTDISYASHKKWSHIASVFRGISGNAEIYINGKSAGTAVATQNYAPISSNIDIGRQGPANNNFYQGNIADMRFYNDALTDDEVVWLYTNGASGTDPTTTDLEAHIKLDEGTGTSFADSTENGHTGTAGGSPTWTTDTHLAQWLPTWKNANGDNVKQRGCYYFDGVNDTIDLGDNVFAAATLTSGTIAAWAKKGSTGTTNAIFDAEGVLYIQESSGDWICNVYDGSSSALNAGAIVVGEWQHITYTWNGTTQITYINGVQTNSVAVSSPTLDAFSRGWAIGSRYDGAANYFDGYIKDVRLYSTVLTPIDITNLYSGALEPTGTLEARWKLDGNALDEDASTNHGTVSGAAVIPDWHLTPAIGDPAGSYLVTHLDSANTEYVDINNTLDNGIGSNSFTVVGWFKYDGPAVNSNNVILSNRDGSTGGFNVTYNPAHPVTNSSIDFFVAGTSVDFYATDLQPVLDSWNHVACVFVPSGTCKMYINGVLSTAAVYGDNTATTTYQDSTNTLKIGVQGDLNASSYYDGYVSNLAMFDDELTSGEISSLYALGPFGTISTTHDHVMEIWPLMGDLDGKVAGNNGTNNGSETLIYSPAYSFDGINDTIDIGDNIFTNAQVAAGAISVWVNPSDTATTQSVIELEGVLYIYIIAGQWICTVYDGSSSALDAGAVVADGKWVHIVSTWNGTTQYVYLNGIQTNSVAVGSPIMDSFSRANAIGSNYQATGSYYEGLIANVAVFDDLLTDAEVKALYNKGYVPAAHDHLVAYWPLAGDFRDKIGTNHGTNSGTIEIQDITRPLAEDPVEQTIDISSLAYQTDAYYRILQQNIRPESTYSTNDISFDYTPKTWILASKTIYDFDIENV